MCHSAPLTHNGAVWAVATQIGGTINDKSARVCMPPESEFDVYVNLQHEYWVSFLRNALQR